MRQVCLYIWVCSLLVAYCSCDSVHANVIYVSSSQGNDNNDGLSPEKPIRTIAFALAKADTIYLKSGDVFYESIDVSRGYVSKYGGDKLPILRGYKRLITPQWVPAGENLWKISLADNNYFGYDTRGSSLDNNIGCVHEYDKDLLHGRKVQYKHEMVRDWDIWQTEHYSNSDTKPENFDSLYLFLRTNPNQLKLEFSVAKTAARVTMAIIDGLRFEGFGFGVGARSQAVIRNCEIDAIGGRIAVGSNEYVCYGNGIEFWIIKNMRDCVAEGNVISRCYDCGCTIQGRVDSPQNIVICNNIIIDCCQGWEDFLTNEDPNVVFKDCVFENNIIVNSGNTSGFGYPDRRFKYCHVLGNNFKGNKGMIIRNNTFVGGNYYCSGAYKGEYKSNVWEGNTCVIKRGDYILGNYTGTKDVIRIPKDKGDFASLSEATDDAIRRYRTLTGDETTKFIIKEEKAINRQIEKLKKKYLRK